MHTFRTRLGALLASACTAALLLAGCSVLPKAGHVQVWQPEEGSSAAAPGTPVRPFSLRVDTPNAIGIIDQSSIVVMPQPGQINTYKGARWSEPPALLVRHRLVDAFMAARVQSVTTDDDHFTADYTLSGDLRAFQSEYRGAQPVIRVRFDAQLRRGGSRHLLATHSFIVTQTPAGVEVPQIVAAFGAADDALARQVVAWTLHAVQANATRHPAPADSPAAAD